MFHNSELQFLDITPNVICPPSESPGLYRRAGKRVLDIAIVLAAAPIVLFLVTMLAVIVACDRSNPFYSQNRVGLEGRTFRLWKLRSMVPDADTCLAAYLATNEEARLEWEVTQKLRNDPRITRFGRFLRRSSLDELPQLFNVLRGDMSLVGPRPMMVEQRPIYPGTDYYLLRPGLTGLWQVSERNGTSFAERAKYDAEYNATLSLAADLRTLWRTTSVVMRGTGV
ncbi:sugar transferase [Paracoccus sp. YIM 132242]|uniref:Sugar transferase n=1 Tax=Paracoccus lichenicola TaxID=2665644 RepID=A0A6L6HQU5_9RHOB|nr:sugar transferase [Paracoccus lichenicola]MTE01517.1 sugar transferase [Paracoccus lichenicola]